MHSCDGVPATAASGPQLLTELGRLMVRAPPSAARDTLLQVKLRAAKALQAGCSHAEYDAMPKTKSFSEDLEMQLEEHVQALWREQIPVCIEVVLAPDCVTCFAALSRRDPEAAFERGRGVQASGILLERWTLAVCRKKNHETQVFSTSQWLLNAVRSQLHFSQVSAWLARLSDTSVDTPDTSKEDAAQRRRKLSHEKCNIKKLESNCDQSDLDTSVDTNPTQRKLNLLYSIKIPGETYKMSEFTRQPQSHTFPLTDIGKNLYLKVSLEILPRTNVIPKTKCFCDQPKRRLSKDNDKEDVIKLNDLNSTPPDGKLTLYAQAVNKVRNVLDDRMHTPCSESGKHKCNYDDEDPLKYKQNETKAKKLDERRLREIAKYKRRMRKELSLQDSSSDSNSNNSDADSIVIKSKEPLTSIPILQASRFDRFKAIGCYRNQTYLTLPATKIETKSPFIHENDNIPPWVEKRTNTIATQTEDIACGCGAKINLNCGDCERKMVRSEANYNLASLTVVNSTTTNEPKLNCDIISNSNNINNNNNRDNNNDTSLNNHNDVFKCDSSVIKSAVRKFSDDGSDVANIIKRPKLKSFLPIADRIDKLVTDRFNQKVVTESEINVTASNINNQNQNKLPGGYELEGHYINNPNYALRDNKTEQNALKQHGIIPGDHNLEVTSEIQRDIELKELNLNKDDTIFDKVIKQTEKRPKHPSVSEDYVVYEKNYYGTIDYHNMESPKEETIDKTEIDTSTTQSPTAINDIQTQSGATFPGAGRALFEKAETKEESIDKEGSCRWAVESTSSMVFHTKTGLPLTSSPAPLKRNSNCFNFDDSIKGVSAIRGALSQRLALDAPRPATARPLRLNRGPPLAIPTKPASGLLGSFEECILKGRLQAVSTVSGFTARLGAYGSFCPPQQRLPVTVHFYALGGNSVPYMGHISLGAGGYLVPRSGSIQVSLLNPHGTLVRMFMVQYELERMPPRATTFLRQRTLLLPPGGGVVKDLQRYLRYLIHLRFMTSKSGKLYLHTDIRIIVSRKADMDAATAHSAILNPQLTNQKSKDDKMAAESTNERAKPCRVFGGCSESDFELGYENQNAVDYELRSFTYGPENPTFSPR